MNKAIETIKAALEYYAAYTENTESGGMYVNDRNVPDYGDRAKEALTALQTLTSDGWQPPETLPHDGTKIDVYFTVGDQNVLSRTYWMVKEQRWNGMAKGEAPLGWMHIPVPPTAPIESGTAKHRAESAPVEGE